MAGYRFTLYVAGESPRSARALESLRALGERMLGGAYELEVVDLTRGVVRAEAQEVLAAPTVVRTSPGPELRVTGDLSDPDAIAAALDLP